MKWASSEHNQGDRRRSILDCSLWSLSRELDDVRGIESKGPSATCFFIAARAAIVEGARAYDSAEETSEEDDGERDDHVFPSHSAR